MTLPVSGPGLVAQAVRDCLAAEVPGIGGAHERAAAAALSAAARTAPVAQARTAANTPARPRAGPGTIALAAIGTIAEDALGSAALGRAFAGEELGIASREVFDGPDGLLAAADWDLALVLSPWKRRVAAGLPLSPSAAETGVVDTALAWPGGRIGINTNSWAVAAALAALIPPGSDVSILLLGAGASARSAALGIRRRWPGARLAVSARDADAAAELAGAFGAEPVTPKQAPDVGADVIINATTWGETASSQEIPFAFPFGQLLAPGRAFFDLNNRGSSLQDDALAGACVVMSGTLMQVITHGCRAALARAARDGK
jgi:shikimate dehydrogenase